MQFLSSLVLASAVGGVNDEDEALGACRKFMLASNKRSHEFKGSRTAEIVPPQGTDFVLTTDIPHGELDVLVLNGLDVEA